MRDSNNSLFEEALFAPSIPDYQMVCKIGGGAYGQVWMALGVTGAHRAIKIVSREDFRFEKTFEREFEGIKHFEPISRAHPGLVDILHVGRSFEENYYYYVMELADDRLAGPGVFDPYSYEPRTLRTDILADKPINVRESIRVGSALAEALHYLHERGLTHRDVKPSNVIFVDGQPKLADIGLVAETGQQTFVGTEGFVPPEGPGTAKADIYSLGMVLYELTTGKDRLDFPELPDDLGLSTNDRRDWQALNGVICQCCVSDKDRRVQSASVLAEQLTEILNPRPTLLTKLKQAPGRYLGIAAGLAALLGGLLINSKPQEPDTADPLLSAPEAKQAIVPAGNKSLMKVTDPESEDSPTRLVTSVNGAYFYNKQGREIGALPLSLNQLGKLPIDEGYILAPGYVKKEVQIAQLLGTQQPLDQPIHTALSRSPLRSHGWTSPLGMVFRYDVIKRRHVSVWPISSRIFAEFKNLESSAKLIDSNNFAQIETQSLFPGTDFADRQLILTTTKVAEKFCQWLNTAPEEVKGWLAPDQRYRPSLRPVFAGRAYGSKLKLVYCEFPTSS